MRTASLIRIGHETKQELGVFILLKADGDILTAKTLERPWLDNEKSKSCIPAGNYQCIYTRSERLSKATGRDYFCYEVTNVPNRTGIRIHSFNYWFEGEGCIAIGNALKDINLDNVLDITHTGATIKVIEKELLFRPFLLQVIHDL